MNEEDLIRLGEDGYRAVARAVPSGVLDELRAATDAISVGTGLRFALSKVPACGEVEAEWLRAMAGQVLGKRVRVVRSILFDKTADSNWLVPWHQDLTVAVRARAETPGWGPWSEKDGVVHVQPPVSVLEEMVTLRLHLDDTPAENGALKVVAGSHRLGLVGAERAKGERERLGELVCEMEAGSLLMMRPLVLHASSKSTRPSRRRVLHVEYAASDLPGPLVWAEGQSGRESR